MEAEWRNYIKDNTLGVAKSSMIRTEKWPLDFFKEGENTFASGDHLYYTRKNNNSKKRINSILWFLYVW